MRSHSLKITESGLRACAAAFAILSFVLMAIPGSRFLPRPGLAMEKAAQTGVSDVCTVMMVDIATDEWDPNNLSDTEPSIAVNPVNPQEISVVTFSEGWSGGRMAPVWKSRDGGATWRKIPQLPQPLASTSGPRDQKIAYDSAGRLHIVELARTPGPGSFVFRQTAGPDDPLTPGMAFGDDQPHLDIDRLSPGACNDVLYSPWLNFGISPQQSIVTVSPDHGLTMIGAGAGDFTMFPNRTTRIALAPDGKAYVIYKKRQGTAGGGFENAQFVVSRSDDCGVTWTAIGSPVAGNLSAGVPVHSAATVQTWFTTSWGNAAKGKVARARSSDAWIAADPGDGDIYAAYVSRDSSTFGQIYVARSTDRGLTWVSTRVTDGTHHSAYPEIAVNDNGAVGVLYIDYDDSGTRTIFRHRFAYSTNNGAAWTDQILQAMDPGPLANADSGFLWGDYEGLTAEGDTFYGVFTGHSIGRAIAQLDPIFFRISVTPRIELPSAVAFPDTCVGTSGSAPLRVCNTGCSELRVNAITPGNPQFSVAPPTGGFPVAVAPGSCFDFMARFTPISIGAKSTAYVITSNDSTNAISMVPANGLARQLQSISCPSDITVVTQMPGITSAVVTYPPPTVTDSFCAVSVVCTPPSGAGFPLGSTNVTCVAVDAASRSVSCNFNVTVFDVCIQDDVTGDFIRFNSLTGDYLFRHCGVDQFSITGRGRVTRAGCSVLLEDDTRVVKAEIIRCPLGTGNTGTATIRRGAFGAMFVLDDSYILNNTCDCP